MSEAASASATRYGATMTMSFTEAQANAVLAGLCLLERSVRSGTLGHNRHALALFKANDAVLSEAGVLNLQDRLSVEMNDTWPEIG